MAMELYLLDKDFNPEIVIDRYKSLIWTERYNQYGDFNLVTDANRDTIEALSHDKYLKMSDSDKIMIIEEVVLRTDAKNQYYLEVTGRSLESILDRRIVGFYWMHSPKTVTEVRPVVLLDEETWTYYEDTVETTYTVQEPMDFQSAIREVLNENIISPKDPKRKINNFKMIDSTDPKITKEKLLETFTQISVYDLISEKCKTYGFGFKVEPNANNEFIFQMYNGADRSYTQEELPWVIFSPQFDNLINSEYSSSLIIANNAAIVGGEGDGESRKFASCGSASGLDRREMFVDANDVSATYGDSNNLRTYSDAEYFGILKAKGEEELKKVEKAKDHFQGEVLYNMNYIFNEDYFLGDIVQLRNEFGMEGRVRITEIIRSFDEKGMSVIPTFESIEN